MTPQEQSMLSDLIGRVEGTQLPEKDPDAQQLIDSRLGRNPDALYILAQTVLVQKYALDQARVQMDQLRRQPSAQEPRKATSFLGNLFGHKDEPQQAQPQRPYGQPAAPPASGHGGGYSQVPYAQGGYAPPAAATGAGSSFLRSAATTAAGVAAGALAFEGVESLMHGFGHSAGFGGGGGFPGGMGGAPGEETVINNYYDSPGDAAGSNSSENAAFNRGNDADLAPQLDQADDVNVGSDDPSAFNVADDANLEDAGSSYDDSASLDDNGSPDDSGGDFGDSGGDDSSFS